MAGIRDRARQYIEAIPLGEITSNGRTAGTYTKYTGLTQQSLELAWASPKTKSKSGCNEFSGLYLSRLGSTTWLGIFNPFFENALKSINKHDAWVPSSSGLRPKYGDVLIHAGKLHQDVALDFQGEILWRMAAGQVNVQVRRCDVLNRVRGDAAYNYANLQGWLDIERYFDPFPRWLPGWWRVYWKGQTFYYHFDRNYEVKWTLTRPVSSTQVPVDVRDTGTVTLDGSAAINMTWKGTGKKEKLSLVNSLQMKENWYGAPVSAFRI